jgi:hypothetical protein
MKYRAKYPRVPIPGLFWYLFEYQGPERRAIVLTTCLVNYILLNIYLQ